MRSRAMQSLTNDYKARHPGIVIYGIGDEPHKLRVSDHNEDDTVGSRAAQSDADSIPEHRAIDVMLGPVFNRQQALASINEILATPEDLARLRYMNFENTQWHMNNGWRPADNSGDPHPTHIHHSGLAAQDDNAAPWLKLTGGSMFPDCKFGTSSSPTDNMPTWIEFMLYSIDQSYLPNGTFDANTLEGLIKHGICTRGNIFSAQEAEALVRVHATVIATKVVNEIGKGPKGDKGDKGDDGQDGRTPKTVLVQLEADVIAYTEPEGN